MGFDAWITLGALAVMVAALVTGRLSPPAAVIGTSAALFVLGVTDAQQAFSGFANTAPITVAALYVIAGAIDRTGALEPLVAKLLNRPGSLRKDLVKLLFPSAVGSAFLANTPIVAMLTPAVTRWADGQGRSASSFLIPLSYATILGGALTAIGTSTNLVASGLLESIGEEPLGLFELATIGLPLFAVGLVVILIGAPFLPKRRRPAEPAEDGTRAFTVAMHVDAGGALDGVSVTDAGLRHLDGLFLTQIDRPDQTIAPVLPSQILRSGDQLVFAGQVDQVVALQKFSGLSLANNTASKALGNPASTGYFELVIGPSSPIVGQTAIEVSFRQRYDAAILAVHRSGELVGGQPGSVRFRAGDTLLVVAPRTFRERWRNTGEFLLISRLDADIPVNDRSRPLAIVALAIAVGLPLFGLLPITRSTILAAILVVVFGILKPREARDAVDVNVVLMIGGAFGLGAAITETGIDQRVAGGLLDSFGMLGTAGAIVGLLITTMVLTELITNAAAVVLAFPIAIDVAEQTGLDPRLLIIGIAVAGSASFLTPVGYQTNMMVYGPGGYRFSDYLRIGVPLSLVTIVVISTIVAASAG